MGKRIIMSENMNYTQNRKYRPVCTIIIVILNILAFAILEFMGDTEDVGFMVKYGAMYTPYLLERGEVYRLFSFKSYPDKYPVNISSFWDSSFVK